MSTGEKLIDVKCPKCEKIHQKKMLWIGNGTPRKMCEACANVIDSYDTTTYSLSGVSV